MKKNRFSKEVEKLIDPINVGTLHFIQFFNGLLPKKIQNKLIKSSSKKTPNMGFVVEPYSYFLCYEIKDLDKTKTLIPDNFKLIKTKIFIDDEPKYYCILGCFNAYTSAFWGMRVEFYVIAEDEKTGLLSWIIVDYDTNTISYDKKNGLSKPNCNKSFITTNYDGTLLVEVIRDDNSRELVFDSDIKNGEMKYLDQRLWLEGNLSIGYGNNLSDTADIFSLKFDVLEVEKALKIDIKNLNMIKNSWYPGLFEKEPSQIVCFPYAQHFISDSPEYSSRLKNKNELIKSINSLDFDNINVFSTKIFKIMFLIGPILSLLITLTLIILLILK